MVERTKHIHAQRSFRFSAERLKTVAKRLVGETTDHQRHIYSLLKQLDFLKVHFFFRGWPHDLIEARFARLLELMRGRLVAILLHSILKGRDDKQIVEYFSSQFFKRRTIKH